MDNLCNNCIHKDICARRMATWGMKSCEHFMEMPKNGEWVHDVNNLYGCSECMKRETMSPKRMKPYCPNCGADMRGKEDG